jgi:hypothetical protein
LDEVDIVDGVDADWEWQKDGVRKMGAGHFSASIFLTIAFSAIFTPQFWHRIEKTKNLP